MGKSYNDSLKVSIILPTYNRDFLLCRCTNSVFDQTYKNWELIIADDGSSDDTHTIVKQIIQKNKNIHYHRNPINIGLPSNRNISLSFATGDLIWFIEDDMILDSNCLKCLVETWNEISSIEPRLGVICPSIAQYGQEKTARRNFLNFVRNQKKQKIKNYPCYIDKWTGLIFRNFSSNFSKIVEIEDCHSCSLYTKNIFKKIMYTKKIYTGNYIGEESDFHFQLRKLGYKIFFQPKAVLYHYTVSEGGCRLPFFNWSYYFIRNHIIFLIRNYRVKSLYMIPFFLVYNFTILVRYIFDSDSKK